MITKKDLKGFGLCEEQTRFNKTVHNGGWYNAAGEKIGWGDLSNDDLRRLAAELPEGEIFVVLGEHDSFWPFVTHSPGPTGAQATTSAGEKAPGLAYLVEHARWFVRRGGACVVFGDEAYASPGYKERMGSYYKGFQCIPRSEVRAALVGKD